MDLVTLPHTIVIADESSLSCGPCHRRASGQLRSRIVERVEKRVAMATAHDDGNRMKTRRKTEIASFLRVVHIYQFLLKSAVARSLIIHTQNCSLLFQWTVECAVNNLSVSSLVRIRGTGAELYFPCLPVDVACRGAAPPAFPGRSHEEPQYTFAGRIKLRMSRKGNFPCRWGVRATRLFSYFSRDEPLMPSST